MNPTPPDEERPVRLFLALCPGAAARKHLVDWRDAWRWPASAVPVPLQRLHLTLHFIGNVPGQRLPGLAPQLDVAMKPFDLNFGHGELWAGGIAVLHPQTVPAPLIDLHQALSEKLTACGLQTEESPLRPHITLARHAQGAEPPSRGPSFRWRVRSYVLVQSVPGTAGGYQWVAQFDR